jgi:hypothetical protein
VTDELWNLLTTRLEGQGTITTLGRRVPNEVVATSNCDVELRSQQARKRDNKNRPKTRTLRRSSFETWWAYLQEHGRASLVAGDPECPPTSHSCITGTILAVCFPERIEVSADRREIRLRD